MKIFRDGDRHEFFGVLTAIVTTSALAAIPQPWLDWRVHLVSSLVALYYFSPDLDLARSKWKSKSLHRWRKLGMLWVWQGFQVLPHTHHRGLTHWPIVGAIAVLGWVAWPLLLTEFGRALVGAYGADVVIAFIAQQLVHLILDKWR